MKNLHFICEVFDTVNKKNGVIFSRYCDVSTFNKAVKHFKQEQIIRNYFRAGYKIEIRVNSLVLWDGEK